jgi:hypothetical protein
VCGGPCKGFPDTPHPITYPFLPGGYPVRRPDMPDDVEVKERVFHAGVLVATPGDRINAGDARRWNIGPDGRQSTEAADDEPKPKSGGKHSTARTREGGQGAETR